MVVRMEKESIAYFYLQKNRVAKRNFYSKIELNEFCVERQDRLVIKAIGIPEYYAESLMTELIHLWRRKAEYRGRMRSRKKERKGKEEKSKTKTGKKLSWDKERLKQVLEEKFRESGAEYFYCGEETAMFLRMERPDVPLFFMEEMLLQYGIRENLILIGSPNILFESVFQNFMQRVNYLKVLCDRPEEYEEVTEWLYENFGIVAVVENQRNSMGRENVSREKRTQREERFREEIEKEEWERVRKIRREELFEGERKGNEGKRRLETLVIDMEPGGKNGKPRIELSELSEETVYMDMRSEGEKARWITKKRKDIHYLSPESLLNKWCHLDTTAQNGYNTRVKLEVL